jgi:hypothetical protein
MNIEKLARISTIVDAKGLHSLSEWIDEVIQGYSAETKRKITLEEAIEHYSDPLEDMIKVADVLDKRDLAVLANEIDRIIEIEALEQQSAIEAILSIYKKKHVLTSGIEGFCNLAIIKEAELRKDNLSPEQRCPFGLSIPEGCSTVGDAILEMEPRDVEFKQNRRIFEERKTGQPCPFAAQIMKNQEAVNCTFGTEVENREIPKIYRGSPIYPRLFEGFNTVNLDRNYYQYHDFSYYSLYGP